MGEEANKILLNVSNIDVKYGHAKVLHNVSLHLNSGELVFIIGRNGAGKTTLLRTIAGFLKPTKGTIFFSNQSLVGRSVEDITLSGIRYIFQDKRVFTQLTVRENLEIAAYPVKGKLAEAIEFVVNINPKMEKLLDTKAGSLSGGERQILLIARALVGNPRVLLIDEPTEGLDARITDKISNVLKKMKGKLSMLIVEQNLSVVEHLADRVCIMKEGKLFEEISGETEKKTNGELEKYL